MNISYKKLPTHPLTLKPPMTPIFFLSPLHSCHGGIDRPSGTQGAPHQTSQTAIHTPGVTQFSLSTFNVGKDLSSHPKNAKDTHLFSQPTSSMPWGRNTTHFRAHPGLLSTRDFGLIPWDFGLIPRDFGLIPRDLCTRIHFCVLNLFVYLRFSLPFCFWG